MYKRQNSSITPAVCPALICSISRSKTVFGTEPMSSRICSASRRGLPPARGADAMADLVVENLCAAAGDGVEAGIAQALDGVSNGEVAVLGDCLLYTS